MSDGNDSPNAPDADDAFRADDARRQRHHRARGIKWMHPVTRPPLDAERALAAIPPDTRTLTGRLMNDPIPGDRRRDRP